MTREEARYLLNNLRSVAEGEEDEAIDLAIEALSAEVVQIKQTDTLIIADALRYLAQDEERNELDRARAEALREQILQYGASMCKPTADRSSGEWQRVDEQPYFRKHYHKVCCSVCHKQGSEKYNFCPSCGARMKGGDSK